MLMESSWKKLVRLPGIYPLDTVLSVNRPIRRQVLIIRLTPLYSLFPYIGFIFKRRFSALCCEE
jgi:hypothetical protein